MIFSAFSSGNPKCIVIKSGIYGALSSAMGTPFFRRSNYIKQVRDDEGNYRTVVDLSRRKGESRFEHFTRLMPWRSGVVEAVRENSETAERTGADPGAICRAVVCVPNCRVQMGNRQRYAQYGIFADDCPGMWHYAG